MKKDRNYRVLIKKMSAEWQWILKYAKRYKVNIAIYIVIGLLGTAMSLGSSVSSKYLIDSVVSHDNSVIIKYGVLVVGLALLRFGFNAVTNWITAVVNSKASNEIRGEIYSNVLTAHWEEINRFHSGDLLNRLEGDVTAVSSGVITFIPSLIIRMAQFLGALAIVLYYDKTMALIALMSAPFLFFSSRYLIKTMRKFNKESRELNGKVLSFSEESMQNIQIIKAFDLTGQYIKNFDKVLLSYRSVKLKYEKFAIMLNLILSVIGLIVTYACYGWGVYRLWQGLITYGTMTLFLQLSGQLQGNFNAIGSMVPSAVSIATSAGRVMEITAYNTESDNDREKAMDILKKSESTGVSVIAKDITFTYADGDDDVFNTMSFEVHPGETIALVGPSGEGKSTILKLLLGLIEPTGGKMYIYCNENESIDISDSTRRFCSYVPQETGMFTGTIADNLRLGNENATAEEMENALKAADAFDFVSALPDGIDTIITEQAANISRGQAQRIAIARALLRKSRILLMDEATSALDTETEKRVLQNIMVSDPTRVCIITTHRESMLKYCDRIYTVTSKKNSSSAN